MRHSPALSLSCVTLSLVLAACGDAGGGAETGATLDPSSTGSIDPSGTTTGTPTGSGTNVSPTEDAGTVGESEGASEGTATTADLSGTGTTAATTGTGTAADDTTTDATTIADDTTAGDDTVADDTTTNDTNNGEECQAPGDPQPCDDGTDDIFKAIGLNCSDDKSKAIPIKNPVITSPDTSAYRVATRFGTAQDPMDPALPAWAPKEGSRFLVIGSGTFPPLQPDGALTEGNGQDTQTNGNPDDATELPGIIHHQAGSNSGMGGTPFVGCDGTNDCSDTLEEQWLGIGAGVSYDAFYMSFDLDVPLGTHGYLLDFVYFTEEWPNYVGASVNDMLVVWSTSETFTGNVTFIENQPLTVTALDPYMTVLPGNPLLAGTGFPGDDEGAATGWYTAKGSAAPGESFTVAISVFDVGDPIFDTVGIIDNFRWDCEGCIPSEVDSCGIRPQ